MTDYSKLNPNDFTQKDLMLHLLQVSQHTVTREELKEDISDLKNDISKVDARFDKMDEKISKVEASLKQDMSKVETSLKQDMSKLDDKISKIDTKFDRVQWLIVATIITVVLKDYVISFITTVAP